MRGNAQFKRLLIGLFVLASVGPIQRARLAKMLQQVLQDMYVDPAVLEQLNEEQRQILFLKMRQEQVRRWKEREEKAESEEKKINKTESTKRVDWLLGKDGYVWVWVMGEARGDKPYKQIGSETSAEARKCTESQRELYSDSDTWNTDEHEQFNSNGKGKVYATCKVFEDD
ncbi:SH2 domain-containing protein 4B-like isoform X1 [Scyliorhinus canicula]|uniref:SH2 domain-containing protein 4B-like isoform X1 n=1 Tax=Scyliorhinus canicula TaxID=7830 RepID=UPI0018F5DED1|nr:SH2 domain-containing protein 4B-like isoform X1 [Scyliorhinus canicula]XP_038651618.1 SH2 domain-containing protein 4B-like isoform X1 [Scyliorhinus canicula]